MATFKKSITINADRRRVWEVLADIGEIHQWNPGVQHSYALNGDPAQVGSERVCELPGKRYLNETVVEWQPEQNLTMRIVKSNLPFERADIRFSLQATTQDTTCVEVSPDYELKYGAFGRVLDKVFVRPAYGRGMEDLLRGLKSHVELAAHQKC